MDPKEIDRLSAANAKYPRVGLADMEKMMRNVWYTTLDRCIPERMQTSDVEALRYTTVCIVLMENGYTVVGTSTPAAVENFNPDLGRKFAYDQCLQKLWPIMGYVLRDHLHQRAQLGQGAQKGEGD